ncbi:MAG: radical SAM family heme chaperone HemW [Mariniblastus sp.]
MNSETFHPILAPRSVYIHVPFCRHRCGYCNFTLVAGRDYLIERFLNALEKEIGWLDQTYELDTLFLGGGTPTHLSPPQLDRLGDILRSRFVVTEHTEVTSECNPNDLSIERGRALQRIGVNRISLGVQSFDSQKLKRLERDHTKREVESAVSVARKIDARISLDLIFASPDESLLEWELDLEAAIDMAPEHLSTYELTYEKGTQFWNRLQRGSLNEAHEDLRAEMYLMAIKRLAANGYEQYEVSSFSKSGHRCQHNLAYWTGDPYFAFGPGASRFVDGIRETNHQSTMKYLKLMEGNISPVADREQLAPLPAAKERLAIGLRMADGLDGKQFAVRTGFTIENILGELGNVLIENDLLLRNANLWKLSQKGRLVCDGISTEILK